MRVMSSQDRCFYSAGAGASFDAERTGDEEKPAKTPPHGETRGHLCGSPRPSAQTLTPMSRPCGNLWTDSVC